MPITFVEREVGVSKMGQDIVREALTSVTRWGMEHRVGQLRSVAGRVRAASPSGSGHDRARPSRGLGGCD